MQYPSVHGISVGLWSSISNFTWIRGATSGKSLQYVWPCILFYVHDKGRVRDHPPSTMAPSRTSHIILAHKRAKYPVPCTKVAIVQDLIREAASIIPDIDPNTIRLIVSGAQLKDPNSSISSVGLKGGSVVMVMGSAKKTDEAVAVVESVGAQELELLELLDSHLAKARSSAVPLLDEYKSLVAKLDTANTPIPRNPLLEKQLMDSYLRTSEAFMGTLLKIDSVIGDGVVREKRRHVVALVQKWLSECDDLKSRVSFKFKKQ